MNSIPAYLQPDFSPLADHAAVMQVPGARFTVLTPRLLRLEFDPEERFEDRPSQTFWYRLQPVPDYQVWQDKRQLEIITGALHLRYRLGEAGFSPENLSIELIETGEVWRYGDSDPKNLRGTLRTLDKVSGAARLEPGLLSRAGHTVIDDSRSLVFNSDGWLETRDNLQAIDLYFFGYGDAYQEQLADYARVAGRVPLLPRWALGNWWSRYWEYSQAELTELMEQFREHNVPLAVCIIDMDWHITDTGNESPGWTGYTWNRELFPDPESMIAWMHEQGLKTALNLHPAAGVWPHEAAYEEMAHAVGVDPETEEPIPFDIADPDFARAYFELLHHPLEEQGVDFWWLDWQQGTTSRLGGLDPLWWLNHLHFYDRARHNLRGFIFSRWGGLGNHRYPIGFSGDTVVNWESLAFQPYQTATAANVLYGWWSHDIGGHMQGVEDAELYSRWVQFGVFSPIMRLHSTKTSYHERRPWGYDAETFRVTQAALQLRHAFIPYLYTMSWRYSRESLSPIRPLYHDYPREEAAYACPDQYLFGSELLAAPFIRPADADTRLSRQVVWLPEGEWFDFFDGRRFAGGCWYALHGSLEEIPLFARAGAIVPLGPLAAWDNVAPPATLDLHIFPGTDNRFQLYEDDGETTAYLSGAYALTSFSNQWEGQRQTFRVEAVEGDAGQAPAERTYRLHFHGLIRPEQVRVTVNGEVQENECRYDENRATLSLSPLTLTPDEQLEVVLETADGSLMRRDDQRPHTLQRMVEEFRLQTMAKATIVRQLPEIINDPSRLTAFAVDLSASQRQALLEVMTGAGSHLITHAGPALLLLWNNDGCEEARHHFSLVYEDEWHPDRRFHYESGPLPRFRVIRLDELEGANWDLGLYYYNLYSKNLSSVDGP